MSKGMQQRLGIAQALVATAPADARRADERTRPGRAPDRADLLLELRAAAWRCCSTRTCSARSSASATAWRSSSAGRSWRAAARPSWRGRAAWRWSGQAGVRQFPEAAREQVPEIVRRAGRGRRARLRRARAALDARGHLPRGGGRPRERRADDRRATRCASRCAGASSSWSGPHRRFLALYGAGHGGGFDAVEQRRGGGRRARRPGAHRLDAARAGDVHHALPRRVLAVFLTLGAVRGDAERGLLQPLVVRPVGQDQPAARRASPAPRRCARSTSRSVYAAAMLITGVTGGWWPDDRSARASAWCRR